MAVNDYTWQKYYEEVYHRQKKVNNTLAMQIGENTAKCEELDLALNRVTGSKFWKLLSPARKLLSGDHLQDTASSSAEKTAVDPEMDEFYKARLELYEDFYGQWIRKNEMEQHYLGYRGDSGRARIREKLYHIVNIETCRGIMSPMSQAGTAAWLLFVSEKGMLADGYAERISLALEEKPEAVIVYADEDSYYTFSDPETGKECCRRLAPNFKPDWSPDTLDSFFYLGNIALLRTDIALRLNWLGSHDAAANVYDLFLQAAELVGKHYDAPEVLHIPQVLFHNNVDKYKTAENTEKSGDSYTLWKQVCDGLKDDLADGKLCTGASAAFDLVKQRAFGRREAAASFLDGQDTRVRQIAYTLPKKHRVSILIPTKDHPDTLKTCLSSIIERTEYDDLEFVIVDNGSSEDNKNIYTELTEELLKAYPHKYIYKPMDFNFSKMCNLAAEAATGEFLLFLNDDTEAVEKDWLKLMAGYAALPHIGAVGAKLLYANSDLIQHVGVTSLAIGPSHKLVIYPDDKSYYYGRNIFAYDMLGVTAACLLIAKNKFNQIGGFDEAFAVAYNDVDFCMKLAASGYVNLQCNGALLYHYESMTRGQDEGSDDKWDRLLHEKERLYSKHPEYYKHDPYYNVNLINNHSYYLTDYDYGYNNHLKIESVRQLDESKLAKISADTFKVSIDHFDIQSKENLDEPQILEIKGWCMGQKVDNSDLAVRVVLRYEGSGKTYEIETDPMPREDLEKAFPDELNNRLCGFVARVLTSDLPSGTIRLGIAPFWLKDDLTDPDGPVETIFTDSVFVKD